MMYWLLSAAIAVVLTLPFAREMFVFRLLPYSSLEFFILLVPIFLLAGLLKSRCKTLAAWSAVLQILNILYLLILFPQPVALAFSGFWFYAVLQWRKSHPRFGVLQGVLLLLPLLLKGRTHEIQFWGLSFATFRAFHLFMDHDLLKELNFRKYFFFVFYFPSLLAGPIDRWPRFKNALAESWERAVPYAQAFGLLGFGILQKYIFAESLRRYIIPEHLQSTRDWILSFYGYPTYLYLDFAGYSSMAMGFSLLVGLSLPLNFNRPFLSVNPQDFWRRFHITLGEWLRDYFFKPLYRVSSRWTFVKSPLVRQNIALFLTFLLMGLWNGFQKQYIISGSLFGVYSVVHNTYLFYKKQKGGLAPLAMWEIWLSRFVMVHFAALALFIFSGIPFKG